MFKKILKFYLLFFIIIIISTLIITLINYFGLMPKNIISILKLLMPVIAIFISSFMLGKNSNKLGYIEGLKFGLIISIIFTLLIVLLDSISYKSIIYYIILTLTSTLGSMIGINRKKDN